MLPQNQHQQLRAHQQTPFLPQNNAVDPSQYILDSPQVAKQMAALTAANHQRMAQNTRMLNGGLPSAGGTSSAPFLGPMNQSAFPSSAQDLMSSSANGQSNFAMQGGYGPPQANNPIGSNPFMDPSMPQLGPPRNQPNPAMAKRQSFLHTLATVMAKQGTPLPPNLTGLNVPTYDPSRSLWAIMEVVDLGVVKLAGKDLDLFKLWGLVFQNGGGQVISANDSWGALLPHFDLPQEYPDLNGAMTPVASMLQQYYSALLHPFEEYYKRNMQEQQKKAQAQMRQGMPGQNFPPSTPVMNRPPTVAPTNPPTPMRPNMNAMNNNGPVVPGPRPQSTAPQFVGQHLPGAPMRPPSAQLSHSLSGDSRSNMPSDVDPLAQMGDPTLLDQDMQGMKRKHDPDDKDVKRVRQKTDPPEGNPMMLPGTAPIPHQGRPGPQAGTPGVQGQSRQLQPSRRKIEYRPFVREVDTYGGRDLKLIESEWANLSQRRPFRDVHEWGTVDIEALTMSIRSRLSIELSYALTTLTLLSTIRLSVEQIGFHLSHSGDLLDELLDLLEDTAFPEHEEDVGPQLVAQRGHPATNKELVSLVHETIGTPFAALEAHQGSKSPSLGPTQRPGDIILVVVNLLYKFTNMTGGVEFLAHHPRFVDVILRLCDVTLKDGSLAPTSTQLSLVDLLLIRKDTLYTLSMMAGLLNLASHPSSSKTTARIVQRTFELVSSYLVDPEDTVHPLATVQVAGAPPTITRPPPLADAALEVFTRFSQSDGNRQTISRMIPQSALWTLLVALVHRLPFVDQDFFMVQQEWWLSFIMKVVHAIYSITFLASPELRQKMRTDRSLAFKSVMLRMAHKTLKAVAAGPPHDNRDPRGVPTPVIFARRAVETLKVLDRGDDPFEKKEGDAPVLSFGMGFADSTDSAMEKGTGLLAGSQDAWEMLMLRDVVIDEQMFNELESLTRIECR